MGGHHAHLEDAQLTKKPTLDGEIKETGYENVDTCSGFGMAYDLLEPESEG